MIADHDDDGDDDDDEDWSLFYAIVEENKRKDEVERCKRAIEELQGCRVGIIFRWILQEINATRWGDPEKRRRLQYAQEEKDYADTLADEILADEQEIDDVKSTLMGLDIPNDMPEYWRETTGQDFAYYWNEAFLNPMAGDWIKPYRKTNPKETALVEESLVADPHRRRLISSYTPQFGIVEASSW